MKKIKMHKTPSLWVICIGQSNGIAKCIREITRGSVMCCYLTASDLIYDQIKSKLLNSVGKENQRLSLFRLHLDYLNKN